MNESDGTLADVSQRLLAKLGYGGLERRIVFIHVPKCGGTAVAHALARASGFGNAKRAVMLDAEALHRTAEHYGEDSDRMAERLLTYHLSSARLRVVSGHYRFTESIYARFGPQWDFITILREPVARFISNYFFNRDVLVRGPFGIRENLETFLASPRAVKFGNVYAQYFAGAGDEDSRGTIERAVVNLGRFTIIGVLDHLGAFRASFRRRYGVNLRIGRENVGSYPGSGAPSAEISPEALRRIEALCAPDREIYDRVVDGCRVVEHA